MDALGYGTVFFDTPPAYNFLTLSALVAADRVLVPFDCDDFARRAIAPLLERVEEVRGDHNPRLRIEGIVVNQFQGRANFPQQAVDELLADGLTVLEPYISASVRIRESHHAARSPWSSSRPAHKVVGRVRGPLRAAAGPPEGEAAGELESGETRRRAERAHRRTTGWPTPTKS